MSAMAALQTSMDLRMLWGMQIVWPELHEMCCQGAWPELPEM